MKAVERWWSDRVGSDFSLARWGSTGFPVLVFPTAGGDCEEIERFHLVDALSRLLAEGRIKIYSVDSLNGRAFLTGADSRHSGWMLSAFDAAIHEEVQHTLRPCRQRWLLRCQGINGLVVRRSLQVARVFER